MFATSTYVERRKRLAERVGSGVLLFLGNEESGVNYRHNTYPFRQDSSFLYFFGIDRPGLAAIIDIDESNEIVFGDELTMDDIVWTGPLPSVTEQAQASGIRNTLPMTKLAEILNSAVSKQRKIHYLPPYRPENTLKLHDMLHILVNEVSRQASKPFIQAVVELRSRKTTAEIQEIENALAITHDMHMAMIKFSKEGLSEADLTGKVHGIAVGADRMLAYPIILTVNGQTLHNHHHANTLKSGELVLGDFGAESPLHYASDITRTVPVAKTFTAQQKEIYEVVLQTQLSCIQKLQPGTPYRDIHLHAARTIVDGLKSVGLMKGDIQQAVETGAHALFFPHGLGHMLGLDVHDMEDLGEEHVGYSAEAARSDQFGLKYLRLARPLQEGFVLTVEPGIYFIPELIDQWETKKLCTDFIRYDTLKSYRRFGGIRIEDNCLITPTGGRVLGKPIPKTISEIESLR